MRGRPVPGRRAAGERAVALAQAAHATEDAERYAEQLARYRAGQPFHFPPPALAP